MGAGKDAIKFFEKETGLTVKEFLEHRTVEWGPRNPAQLFVFKIVGKRHPAFMLFENDQMKTWGYILPCARYGLKNEISD